MCVCVTNGDDVSLQDPPQPQIDQVMPSNPSDCAVKDGGIQISASGGSGSYHYSINGIDWQSSPVFSGLGSGSYPALVRNSDGTCRVQQRLDSSFRTEFPIITFINPKIQRIVEHKMVP
ncbi:MAG: hypothetical protein R2784_02225 [Saprospiraceae bacterium]